MIDYDKLEKARKLCSKLKSYFFNVDFCIAYTDEFCVEITLNDTGSYKESFGCFEDLIAKLEELTKPEPKYRINQLVWLELDNDIRSFVVERIEWDGHDFLCYGDILMAAERFLFPTRQALIEHQIQYWSNLLKDELEQHVSPYCEPDTQSNQSQVDKVIEDAFVHGKGVMHVKLDDMLVNADRCQHESDGEVYPIIGFKAESYCFKCIKCGELYI